MKLNDLLLDIDNMNNYEYELLKQMSKRIIKNYAYKKEIDIRSLNLDDIIDLAISQFKNRYNEKYKTVPLTFFHTILIRRLLDSYVMNSKIYSNEDLCFLNDEEHNSKVERALIYYDKTSNIEQEILDLKTVSDKNKEILILVTKGFSNSDISRIKGISRQRVSQLLKSLSKNYEIKALLNK